MERCLIAPHDLKNPHQLELWLESGARISSCPYKGRRIAVKGPRYHNNRNSLLARWPQDKLQAKRIAMLAVVLKGQTDFRVGEQMLHCSVGHSILLLPGVPAPDGSESHLTEENRQHGQCDILWISAGLGCWICHSEGKRHFELPGESCYVLASGIRNIFNEFVREASEQQQDYRVACNYLMQALLSMLCREIKTNHLFQFNYQKPQASSEFEQNPLQDPITAAQDYMKNHFHEPLQIDEVARHLLLSRTEFTQSFKRRNRKNI